MQISVTCPVAKDIEAGRIKRAEVMVFDRNPNANPPGTTDNDVSCALATVRRDGTVQQTITLRTFNSSPSPLPLTFSGQSAAPKGSYSLVCDLPPSLPTGLSSIVMYNVVEE